MNVSAPQRNTAIDAYRGFVMLLMMAEVLRLSKVAAAYPGNAIWSWLAFNQTHAAWVGCSLHDLIQPSFSFLVGVAVPYSVAARLARGGKPMRLFGHAVWRALVLVALGIFLRSMNAPITNFTFEDTLTQIGLGYPFLFLLGFVKPRWQWTALGVILVGYWLAWAVYPVAAPGWAAHWSKEDNLAVAFDRWFLNLFPRQAPFVANRGGYVTLSFIPTLGTMLLGLIAGQWLRAAAPRTPLKRLAIAGVAGVVAGLLLHTTGVCPLVKRIWTPTWTVFSGGCAFLLLGGFSAVINDLGYRRWSFPLVVIGMNSIAAYLIAHLFEGFIASSLRIHLGANFFAFAGAGGQLFLQGLAVLLCYWLFLFWMYRRKLFLKV